MTSLPEESQGGRGERGRPLETAPPARKRAFGFVWPTLDGSEALFSFSALLWSVTNVDGGEEKTMKETVEGKKETLPNVGAFESPERGRRRPR